MSLTWRVEGTARPEVEMREYRVDKADGGFHMICEAKGNLRYRARTTTALATIALVAGGYLVMSGTTAKAEPGASVNEARKEDKLIAADANSNEAGKEDKLIAAGANSNEAHKKGKLTAAGASGNEARKKGKLIAAGASGNEARKEGKLIQVSPGASGVDHAKDASRAGPQYLVQYNTIVTSSQGSPDASQASPGASQASPGATQVAANTEDLFQPGPQYEQKYNSDKNVDVYGGKSAVETPRPLLELGREQYTSGQYDESGTLLGDLNPLLPGLSVYGDWRTAVAYNNNNGKDIAQIATRLNLDVDFKITGTERLHAFFTPLQDDAKFTRFEFGGGDGDEKGHLESDLNPQTLFFEGDVGSIYAGLSGNENSFDLPFTVGLFPLFLQNGIWANDAILGGAVSLTAKNSQKLGLSNYDVTFFSAFDNVDNALFKGNSVSRNNNVANLYGVTTFVDAFGGYIEAGYGLIQGVDDHADGQYTNFLTAAFTKRYYDTISNSTRLFGNFGNGKDDEGIAIISENSLVSGLPSTLLPYANFFFGSGNPQPLVDGNGAGILKNVGINFQTDALTGFPKLNDTGSNAFGGAIGLQYLFNLDQQLVFEAATVQPYGDPIAGVGAKDPQYALGVRYQIPITQAWLFRADATYQIIEGGEDNWGVRTEIRRKF